MEVLDEVEERHVYGMIEDDHDEDDEQRVDEFSMPDRRWLRAFWAGERLVAVEKGFVFAESQGADTNSLIWGRKQDTMYSSTHAPVSIRTRRGAEARRPKPDEVEDVFAWLEYGYPAFPILVLLGFFIVMVPLPWHFSSQNSGTCLYIVWTAIACLNQFVNSVIWHNSAEDHTPVWCDVSSRVMVAVAVAIPASYLCINWLMYDIATVKSVSMDKRDRVTVDLLIGIGIPLLQVVLYYVVEDHRYDILEDVGCYPAIHDTPVAFALVRVLVFKATLTHRTEINEVLSQPHSPLSMNVYYKLMALFSIELLLMLPFNIFILHSIASRGEFPWQGWTDTHENSSRVIQRPYALWTLDLLFFAFFGATRLNYREFYDACTRHAPLIICRKSSETKASNPGGTISTATTHSMDSGTVVRDGFSRDSGSSG
ncbi:hypothetical protein EW146_g7998 [Bondarzewia mesenterica]|uniref:G-protein coupled receptors family 1 profile domain-containing protein n=1 Tax=Bondarzewia mesenterica TaxID=1095465 RepID=A0A4S4LJL5_9AGAM|nr:hypothetical protein EW146_g7998 [Bondarzewia mesenterica]